MLTPVTPWAPKKLKSHPPTTAPTIPRMMSRKRPSPDLLTILLPIKPATRPSTIHARIDIVCSLEPELEPPLKVHEPVLAIHVRHRPPLQSPVSPRHPNRVA